jgi:antitoxin (DNA-binding transcriptional repressor) of toxin-antitoxin stability system
MLRSVTAAHAYELPPREGAPAEVVDAAVGGDVVYLTRGGEAVAAVVPADAAEYLEALEDAADVIAARRALSNTEPRIPLSELLAENAAILAEYPADEQDDAPPP